jgi:hypothetical protein
MYMFYSKNNNNSRGFGIPSQKVTLFSAMDKNIKEKKVLCGM